MEGARRETLSPENVPMPDEEQGLHSERRTLAKTTDDVCGPYASGRHGIARGSKDRAQTKD